MDTLRIMRQFLSEQYGILPESVTPETSLDTIGVDSLTFFEVIFEFESKFGFSAPNEKIAHLKTIGELVALIDQLSLEKQ